MADMKLPSTPDQFPPGTAFDEIVEIKVGEGSEQKTFSMHKGVLCFYSGYFRGAFEGNFREAKEKVLTLEKESVTAFQNFQQWAYQRRIIWPGKDETDDFRLGVGLWVFADAHLIPLLQNEAINSLQKLMVAKWAHWNPVFDHVYERTAPGSALRKFVVDEVVNTHHDSPFDYNDFDSKHIADMMRDILPKVWRKDDEIWHPEDLANLDMCKYHKHGENVKCVKKGDEVADGEGDEMVQLEQDSNDIF